MRHPQCVPSLANISLLLAYNKANWLFGADKHRMSNANKHKSTFLWISPVWTLLEMFGMMWVHSLTQDTTEVESFVEQFDAESQHVISLKELTLTLTLMSSHYQVDMNMWALPNSTNVIITIDWLP